jgi:hypothetical protein
VVDQLGLRPGDEIKVTVQATPRSTVSILLNNVNPDNSDAGLRFQTREVSPGVYKGTYRIRREDKITGRVGLGIFLDTFKGIIQRLSIKDFLPRYAANVSSNTENGNESNALRISQLSPPPGKVTVTLRPRISATFDDPDGIDLNRTRVILDRQEITSNLRFDANSIFYVPRQDLTPGNHSVTVRSYDRQGNPAQRSWEFQVPGNTAPNTGNNGSGPDISRLSPAPNAQVTNSRTPIKASFDSNGVGIDLNSVRIFLDSQDVTDSARFTEEGILLRPDSLRPGNHTVVIQVADRNGGKTSQRWNFQVTDNNY